MGCGARYMVAAQWRRWRKRRRLFWPKKRSLLHLSGGSVVGSRGPCCFLWVKLNIVFVSQTDYLDLTQTLFFERALCCFLWVDFCEYLWVKLNTFLGGNWANIWSGIFEEIGFDIEPDFWQWASLRVVYQAEYFFENWVWPLTESYAASCESSWKCF